VTSMFYEDLVEGQTFVSKARTVTESDVVGFAGLSGDFNPIHLDRESTKDGMFGERVAHGILGLAMATGFLDSLGLFKESMGAMLGIEDWRFVAPILFNDTIHLELTIESKRLTSKGTSGVVRRRLRLINQHGAVVQDGIITVLILCREPVAPGSKKEAGDVA
jgi:acyl dehydratase